jgi:tetratricopeptide (TPR) repeat protein
MGIAVQSLREALKVYAPESHPELYASVRMNLANALQYLPSSHPEENLQQAVEIYEELLQIRQRALDPIAYARTLFNQANALGHLGIFAPALEKLAEAHKLFHWHGEPDLAAEALAQSATIQSQRETAMALPATQ